MGGPQASQPGVEGVGRRPTQVRFAPLKLEEIVRSEVVTASPDTSISDVVNEMADSNVGSVVIVEEDRPVGIVTDRKIALAIQETPDIAERTVDEFMTDDPITATPEMDVFDLLDQMRDNELRRVPVVDQDGTLQGIVALDDVIVLLSSQLERVSETIQGQFPDL